jgi:hypothetical protein
MRLCSQVIILLAASIFSFPAHAQSRIDCNALNSRILKYPVHYCVYLARRYDAGATSSCATLSRALFLHGLGDNEQTLFNSGGWTLLDDLRQKHKVGDFLIVAPEGRRTFYINSADGSVRYSDFFLQEFVPSSKANIASAAGAEIERSAASPWADMVRCASPLAIQNVFRGERAKRRVDYRVSPGTRYALTAPALHSGKLLAPFSETRSTFPTGKTIARLCWPRGMRLRCERWRSISTAARTTTTASKRARPRSTINCKRRSEARVSSLSWRSQPDLFSRSL